MVKKKKPSYEGNQYRGGRTTGRKNLKKTSSGKLVNQYGVTFTPDEKRALENAVNAANRKRKKMLKEAATLPRYIKGRDSGDTVGSLQQMGKESDFILAKRTKSLQRFQSKEQYNKYMKSLKNVNSPGYIDERIRMYKRNHMAALKNVFGDDAKDIMMKIRMMKPRDYMKMIEQDEFLEINYIYDPTAREGKLNQLRATLGMKLKDESLDIEDY